MPQNKSEHSSPSFALQSEKMRNIFQYKGYTKMNDFIESKSIPNSIYLWNTIKD